MTMPRRRSPIHVSLSALVWLIGLAACDSADDDGAVATETTRVATSTAATSPATPQPTTPAAGGPGSSVPPSPGSVPDLSIAPDGSPPTPAGGTLYAVGDVDPALEPWITLATDDLATRLGIAAAGIEPSSAVLVVWPDSSLGCPAPGMSYATVLTDGAVIELDAGGTIYRYHAGGSASPFLCDVPLTVPPARLPG